MKDDKTTTEAKAVSVKKLKPKQKKKESYVARNTNVSCPNCMSAMRLDEGGLWECSGDKLQIWEPDFVKYKQMAQEEKFKYLRELSNSSRFLELFDRWDFAHSSGGEEIFNCGYTNLLFPINGSMQVKIPDPLFTKILEQKLGRSLTEEELYGESELFSYGKQVLTSWKKNAKLIRIPFVVLPTEDTIYETVKSDERDEKK